jgi:hypothetical protein
VQTTHLAGIFAVDAAKRAAYVDHNGRLRLLAGGWDANGGGPWRSVGARFYALWVLAIALDFRFRDAAQSANSWYLPVRKPHQFWRVNWTHSWDVGNRSELGWQCSRPHLSA